MTETPEQRLANRIVEQHNLTPPVDIVDLAGEYARLDFVEWPYECDGLTVGLTTWSTPRIFIRENNNKRRQRFTIAHELGHVLLPWHIEEVACTPEASSGSFFRGGQREREASTFASHLLLPDRFLEPLCTEMDIPEALKVLEQAELSIVASIIAFVRALPPGVAFVVDDDVYSSRGTVLPAKRQFNLWGNRNTWSAAEAPSHGRARFRGKSLRWFKFEQFEEPQKVSDPRESTQLLRDAIAAITDDPREQQRLLNVVNGVIGAAMTSENRTSPARAYGAMRHRIRARVDLAELFQEPDFDLFLRRRAFSHSTQ